MNFYSASVALLWTTAFRVVASPTVSRHAISRMMPRKDKMRLRPGRDVIDGASRSTRLG